MSRFLKDALKGLEPYVPGEQPRGAEYVKLNTNESPFTPSPAVIAAAAEAAGKLNLYSDPAAERLTGAVAARYNRILAAAGEGCRLGAENVFAGNGSDEVLAFAFYAFCDAAKGMACPEVGYGFYPVYCSLFGLPFVPVPLREDFSIDVSAFNGVRHNVTIANPNAQTGLYMPINDIKTLLSADRDRLVIIDEAYCDFGGESACALLEQYDNLLIVGTLSKSRQLAGGRVGYALGSAELIAELNAVKFSFNPYNLGSLSIAAGAAAMDDDGYFEYTRARIIAERERMKGLLCAEGFRCTQSAANFVLAAHPAIDGRALYTALKDKGILVRFLPDPKLSAFIRITVGSENDTDKLMAEIRNILEDLSREKS